MKEGNISEDNKGDYIVFKSFNKSGRNQEEIRILNVHEHKIGSKYIKKN